MPHPTHRVHAVSVTVVAVLGLLIVAYAAKLLPVTMQYYIYIYILCSVRCKPVVSLVTMP